MQEMHFWTLLMTSLCSMLEPLNRPFNLAVCLALKSNENCEFIGLTMDVAFNIFKTYFIQFYLKFCCFLFLIRKNRKKTTNYHMHISTIYMWMSRKQSNYSSDGLRSHIISLYYLAASEEQPIPLSLFGIIIEFSTLCPT